MGVQRDNEGAARGVAPVGLDVDAVDAMVDRMFPDDRERRSRRRTKRKARAPAPPKPAAPDRCLSNEELDELFVQSTGVGAPPDVAQAVLVVDELARLGEALEQVRDTALAEIHGSAEAGARRNAELRRSLLEMVAELRSMRRALVRPAPQPAAARWIDSPLVLAVAGSVLLAWSVVLWVKTGSPLLALGTLVLANGAAGVHLLSASPASRSGSRTGGRPRGGGS